MVYDKLEELIAAVQSSDEHKEYKRLGAVIEANVHTKALVDEYHKLQWKAQASSVMGAKDEVLFQKMQKMGELLQLDPDASQYLLAEYRINTMLSDIYKRLASAVGISLDMLEG